MHEYLLSIDLLPYILPVAVEVSLGQTQDMVTLLHPHVSVLELYEIAEYLFQAGLQFLLLGVQITKVFFLRFNHNLCTGYLLLLDLDSLGSRLPLQCHKSGSHAVEHHDIFRLGHLPEATLITPDDPSPPVKGLLCISLLLDNDKLLVGGIQFQLLPSLSSTQQNFVQTLLQVETAQNAGHLS